MRLVPFLKSVLISSSPVFPINEIAMGNLSLVYGMVKSAG